MTRFTLVIALIALGMTLGPASNASARGKVADVFLDEGDADFGDIPVPSVAPTKPEAEEEKPTKAKGSARKDLGFDEPADEAPAEAQASTPATEPAPAPAKAKKQAAQKEKAPRKPAAAGSFMTTQSACPMVSEPTAEASSMGSTKANRKIWVENVDQDWVRVYNKAGDAAFIKRNCFE